MGIPWCLRPSQVVTHCQEHTYCDNLKYLETLSCCLPEDMNISCPSREALFLNNHTWNHCPKYRSRNTDSLSHYRYFKKIYCDQTHGENTRWHPDVNFVIAEFLRTLSIAHICYIYIKGETTEKDTMPRSNPMYECTHMHTYCSHT